jgi:hypothetical protein
MDIIHGIILCPVFGFKQTFCGQYVLFENIYLYLLCLNAFEDSQEREGVKKSLTKSGLKMSGTQMCPTTLF